MTKKSPRQQFKDMGPSARAGTLALSAVQLSLAAAAWADLARRPADQVNGRKGVWAAVIGLNYVGPIGYFLKGRRTH